MPKRKKILVKTVYGPTSMRDPGIVEYSSEKEAKMMVEACLKWGIDIVSCEIIENKELK